MASRGSNHHVKCTFARVPTYRRLAHHVREHHTIDFRILQVTMLAGEDSELLNAREKGNCEVQSSSDDDGHATKGFY